jgi:valyl-tRNA synthetase
MAKSKGNVVTPVDLLDKHGSDALRYWAASGRPGTDTAFDEGQMKIGRRLAIKILNASRFVLGLGVDAGQADRADQVVEPLDRAQLAALADVVAEATAAFDDYNYTRALEVAETHFWAFCDDYVELVKDRAYGGRGQAGADSARAALATALGVQLRLFAPFLPFVTEEVWSWWQEGSVHRAEWPTADEVTRIAQGGDPAIVADVADVLSAIRRAKSDAKVGMRADVAVAELALPQEAADRVRAAVADIAAAGRITDLQVVVGEPATRIELAPVPPA